MRFPATAVLALGLILTGRLLAEELPDGRQEVRVLFIGNSFTAYNDVHETVAELYEDAVPGRRMTAVAVAPDGYRLAQHAEDARTRGRALHRRLHETAGWDFVVLQEQSHLAAVDPQSPQSKESLAAAAELADAARASGARVVFFMTWGYLAGDPTNPQFAPDYPGMQDRIAATYPRLVESATPEDALRRGASRRRIEGLRGGTPRPVVDPDVPLLAPVGLAFRKVYDDEVAAGRDPLAADSPFRALYVEDGGHPSVTGSYLAACALCAAIAGEPVAGARHIPLGLDPDVAAKLRAIADRTGR